MTRPRISDVAKAAGVSTATVSLALNNVEARIPEDTRERVRAAAAALGYAPNSVAKSLRTQKTNTVGLISDVIATTPFAGRMLAGAQEAAREQGYLLILVDTGADPAVEREAIQALANQRVDAWIYARMRHTILTDLPAGLPARTVLLDCRTEAGDHVAVVPDDERGGYEATLELVNAGHRRIAYLDVTDQDRPPAADLRYAGHVTALREAGITPEPALRVYHEISAAGGHAATDALLDLADPPTALFCFNDRMAVGAYAALHARGLAIPGDVSVIGYDDQQFVAAEQDPPLTTMALPHYEMGRWAMERALSPQDDTAAGQVHYLPCPLVRRHSVTSPPARETSPDRRRA
jgi:LacI family transcriptional regulator